VELEFVRYKEILSKMTNLPELYRIIVILVFEHLMKLSNILHLRKSDFDFDNASFKIPKKRRLNDQTIEFYVGPFSMRKETSKLISKFAEKSTSEYLFITKSGLPFKNAHGIARKLRENKVSVKEIWQLGCSIRRKINTINVPTEILHLI